MLQRVHKMGIKGIPLSQLDGFNEDSSQEASYQEFVILYAQYFYENKVPFQRLNDGQGKAMKNIVKTILALDVVNGDSLKALAAWKLLLENVQTSDKVNPFLKSQTFKPATFDKYLIEIIQKLRNENGTQQVATKHGKYAQ